MRPPVRIAGLTAVCCLALTACGGENDGGTTAPSAPVSTPASSSQPTAPTTTEPTVPPSGTKPTPTAPQSAVFPMTITRKGGFVGYDDSVVLTADGTATITQRGRSSRCRVDVAVLRQISTAAAGVDWQTLPAKPPVARHPDDLVIAVSAAGGTARLDDPRVRPVSSLLIRLLGDASASEDKRKLCRPM
jgi:hypothetical protein